MVCCRTFAEPMTGKYNTALDALQAEIVACTRCPRLRAHCQEIARVKRRAYKDWEYWGLPAPSFGDPCARLLIVGLAPGAHGANRTGRMFTGDSSGDLLYRTLYETGFASQPEAVSRDDGLVLRDAYITASAHCAPPQNKPTREEFENCRPYLRREIELLESFQVVVALGLIGHQTFLKALVELGRLTPKNTPKSFGHNELHQLESNPRLLLIDSYHPSRQNTQTGRLTPEMFRAVFERARSALI